MDLLRAKTVRRVPLDFRWPLGEPWHGYINPWPGPVPCVTCDGLGYNHATLMLYETFDAWAPKITKKEIEALFKCKFTPKDVERLKKGTLRGKDAPILRFALTEIRSRRKNLWSGCEICDGSGEVPNPNPAVAALYEGVNLYETWEPVDPPTGEGWQLWEEDGVPLSPVFTTAAALAKWCRDAFVADSDMLEEGWVQWILSVKDSQQNPRDFLRPFRLMSDRFQVFVEPNAFDDGSH